MCDTGGADRDNFQKVMELVRHIAQLDVENRRRGTRVRRLTAEEKVH